MHKAAEDNLLFPPEPQPVAPTAPAPGYTRAASREWTAEQLRGIRTVDRSLLVSAAAGSGKTAVLAERCAYLVCDAPRPCETDELLVVTFTEAAALEMKTRITAALRDRAKSGDSPRAARQHALIDQANVSTLHSFCVQLLRQYFHVVGLDPSFRVMDADEAYLLRREIGKELLRDAYELDESGQFQRFIDGYADGDDSRILRRLLHTHELLTSVVDPEQWIRRSRRQIEEAAAGPLEESALGHELLSLVHCGLESCKRQCAQAREQVIRLGFAKYGDYVHDLGRTLDHWLETLETGGLDALWEVVQIEWERLPRETGDAADREIAKAAIDAVRGQMKAGGWRDVLRFSSSQWKQGLAAILPHVDVFLALLSQFQTRYANAKGTRALDFADLERFALRALRDPDSPNVAPSDVAISYHRRFAHVLVDEYQDINEVQDAILNLVSRECVIGRRKTVANLFCVGDVKQSIYRFRLAEAARFLARHASFLRDDSHGQVIDLQHNFRSRPPLIDAINSVFERLMTAEAAQIHYDENHRLQPGPTAVKSVAAGCFKGAPIEFHLLAAKPRSGGHEEDESSESDELDRTECEALFVARRIRQLLGLDGSTAACVMRKGIDGPEPHPARPGDMVILLRSMKHKARDFAAALLDQGIPVHADAGGGYFETVEIRDMLALLSILDNRRQDIPLATVLRSPIVNPPLSDDALASIRAACLGGEKPVAFHEAVIRYANGQQDVLACRLREILARIEAWRHAARTRPLEEAIWQIYRQTHYLAYVAGLSGGEQRVANLLHLSDRAAQFGSFQRQGLSRFIRFLQELEEESDVSQPSVASEAQDAVRIMSIHASKGLEFPIVILPDLGKAMNLSDCQGHILVDREIGLGLSVVDEHKRCRYPSLALTLVKERIRRQTLAEELRVLYVAMTRAKEHLIMVGTCREEAAEKWRTQWSSHKGPLPPDAILGARTMLDWLGPVAAASVDAFAVTTHAQQEIRSWPVSESSRQAFTPSQEAMARLAPLEPEPPISQSAARAIARVSYDYPFQPYTQLPAASAVTSDPSPGSALAQTEAGLSEAACAKAHPMTLALPRFLSEAAPSAVDRGAAMHLVLQHLNFTAPCDAADVQVQIQSMVERRILTATQADGVDWEAITWLMASEAGTLLRRHASIARRELPIFFAKQGPAPAPSRQSSDPLDRIMMRGRIDILLPLPGGSTLIDYKTDALPPDAVPAAVERYRPQLETYRDAIEKITGTRVVRAALVFLSPRQVVFL